MNYMENSFNEPVQHEEFCCNTFCLPQCKWQTYSLQRDLFRSRSVISATATSLAIFSFWQMWASRLITNVQSAWFLTWTFLNSPLVHIHRKERIAVSYVTFIDFHLLSSLWTWFESLWEFLRFWLAMRVD